METKEKKWTVFRHIKDRLNRLSPGQISKFVRSRKESYCNVKLKWPDTGQHTVRRIWDETPSTDHDIYLRCTKKAKKNLKLLVFSTYILTFRHAFKYIRVTLRPFLFRALWEGFFDSQFKYFVLCNLRKVLHIKPVNIAKTVWSAKMCFAF